MKDFSKAGPRQCDLVPYSNPIIASLVAPKMPEVKIISLDRHIEPELPDGVWQCGTTQEYLANCCICDYAYVVDEIEGFDEDHSYCGGSPRCCP